MVAQAELPRYSSGMIYLDHAASTPCDPRVAEAVARTLLKEGNPSSIHQLGQAARNALEEAREEVASFLGAAAEEVVFTSGGTESNCLAILGAASQKGCGHVVVSAIEHKSVLGTAALLEKQGFEVSYVYPDARGWIEPEAVLSAVRPDTFLVTLMHANNETGVIQPIEEVARRLPRGVLFHTDAVQSAAWGLLNVEEASVHLASIAGHKMYGPQGIGALVVRKRTALRPLLLGGGQERGMRAGTPNVPGAVGLATACRILREELGTVWSRVRSLRDEMCKELKSMGGEVRLTAADAPTLPGHLHFCLAGHDADTVLMQLDLGGIAVSSGSACQSGARAPSHVLAAQGVPPPWIECPLRVSLGWHTSREQCEAFLACLRQILDRRYALNA